VQSPTTNEKAKTLPKICTKLLSNPVVNKTSLINYMIGRSVAEAASQWLPTLAARVRVRAGFWRLWWTKRQWGMFSPSTSVSIANHSTDFSIIIITGGWYNRPIGGRSGEWTQLDSTPPPTIPI
jgi:hypothetical protein